LRGDFTAKYVQKEGACTLYYYWLDDRLLMAVSTSAASLAFSPGLGPTDSWAGGPHRAHGEACPFDRPA
jgi:hypothetical protein